MAAMKLVFLALSVIPIAARAQMLSPEQACLSVKGPAPAKVGERTLREAPDLASDELRNINATMNQRGCFQVAAAQLEAYEAAHPDDFTASFVKARLVWRAGSLADAVRLLEPVVREHPDFASGHVLLGAMATDQGKLDEARNHYDAAAKNSPDDLWMHVGRLRIAAQLAPTVQVGTQLVEIARSPAVPGFAREQSAMTVIEMRNASLADREAAFRLVLDFESATPWVMKATNLGRFLIRDAGRMAEGRAVLVSVLEKSNYDEARLVLAESWLLEAAAIDALPSAKNAEQVEKAKQVLGGDLSALAPRVSVWPNLRALRPFVYATKLADPDARDENGRTAACNAAVFGDADALARALAAGGNPDVECGESTAVRFVALNTSEDWALKRQLLQMLLDKGASPDPVVYGTTGLLAFCREEMPVCKKELLPLLEQYAKKQ